VSYEVCELMEPKDFSYFTVGRAMRFADILLIHRFTIGASYGDWGVLGTTTSTCSRTAGTWPVAGLLLWASTIRGASTTDAMIPSVRAGSVRA